MSTKKKPAVKPFRTSIIFAPEVHARLKTAVAMEEAKRGAHVSANAVIVEALLKHLPKK